MSCWALGSAGATEASTSTVSGEPAKLQEIIVTAEKVAQSLQKLPASVTVLGQKELQDIGAAQFTDYAPNVPALSFESLAKGEQRILLRGVSDGVDVALRGKTQNVTGVYIDDMVVSNNYSAPDLNLFDVNRIEVLKGPQGTLYGDGSVGGLIRIITNKANPNKFEAEVEGTGAWVNRGSGDYAVNGMINAPLSEGTLAVRLVGQYAKTLGYIDDLLQGPRSNSAQESGFRGSLGWIPSESFSLTLNALEQHTQLGADNAIDPQLRDLQNSHLFPNSTDTKFELYNATIEWKLPWASFTSSSSYDTYHRIMGQDATYPVTAAFSPFLGALLPSTSLQSQNSSAFSQEMRLVSPSDQRLRWLLGAYYFHANEEDTEHDPSTGFWNLYNSIAPFLGLPTPIQGGIFDIGQDVVFNSKSDNKRREYAGFGELTYDLTSTLSTTVGLRYFDDSLTSSINAAGFATFNPPYFIVKSTSHTGSALKFRVADQLTSDALIYATASQGYRVGGLNPLSPANIANPSFPLAFGPDHLWNYEFGWKTRWLEQAITFNGAIYYVDWKNIQVQHNLPNGFSAIANAGSAKIKGIESEISYRATEHIEMGLNGSVIAAQLGQDAPELGGRKGDQLTGVPKSQGSLFLQGTFPAFAGFTGFARADVQHTAKIRRYFASDPVNANLDSYGDYTLTNLRFGVQDPTLRVALFVKNLMDKRAAYFSDTVSGTFGATGAPFAHTDIYVAQPRTVGITIDKRF